MSQEVPIDREIWHAIHEAHRDRKRVEVVTQALLSKGSVTGISDDDFTLAEMFKFPWTEVERVTVLADGEAGNG